MKKEYKALELEVIRFDAEDVITTSSDDCPRDSAACLANNYGTTPTTGNNP